MASAWKEHRAADGRLYWHHSQTQQSVWEKPDELKTPLEAALSELGWKQYFSNTGKPYYVNSASSQTVWEVPEDVKSKADAAAATIAASRPPPQAPAPAPAPAAASPIAAGSPNASAPVTVPVAAAVNPNSIPVGRERSNTPASTAAGLPVANSLPTRPPGSASANAGRAGSPPNGGGTAPAHHHHQQQRHHDASSMQLAAPGSFVPGQGATGPPSGLPANPMQQQQQHGGSGSRGDNRGGFDFDPNNKEEAEKTFHEMLRRYGVNPTWTWEQVLRTVVTDPIWRALHTLGERKAAFESFCDEILKQQREIKEKNMDRYRPAWRTALGRLSEGDYGMKSWWAWERAAREIQRMMPDVWQMARNDDERESQWREYVEELSRKEAARAQEIRSGNIEKLTLIIKNLDIDLVSTRFSEASAAIKIHPNWQEDTELQTMEPLDFLIVYEENVKKAEQEAHTARQKDKTERQRRIRKNREAYMAMLQDLKSQGEIRAGTKWIDIYPKIKEDQRFIDMLANPGSTALELFWDVVDEMDQRVEADSRTIENAMNERGYSVTAETSFDEFDAKIREHHRVQESGMSEEARRLVHKNLLNRLEVQAREERRRHERRMKHLSEDLRYALRKVDPPLDLSLTYDEAVDKIKDLPEFIALDDEAARRSSYERFVDRQKERLAERESSRSGVNGGVGVGDGGRGSSRALADGYSDTESHASTRRPRRGSRTASVAPDRERERERGSVRDRDRNRDRDRDERSSRNVAGSPRASSAAKEKLSIPTSPRASRRRGNDSPARVDDEKSSSSRRERERGRDRSRSRSRDRAPERERERERARDKDRNGDRPRERERDRGDRDRDSRSGRDRERERERDSKTSSRSRRNQSYDDYDSRDEQEEEENDEEERRRSSKRRSTRRDHDEEKVEQEDRHQKPGRERQDREGREKDSSRTSSKNGDGHRSSAAALEEREHDKRDSRDDDRTSSKPAGSSSSTRKRDDSSAAGMPRGTSGAIGSRANGSLPSAAGQREAKRPRLANDDADKEEGEI